MFPHVQLLRNIMENKKQRTRDKKQVTKNVEERLAHVLTEAYSQNQKL
jgi:hypothetical protein